MKLTIIQTGEVPPSLQDRFGPYPSMFQRMFDATGERFDYAVVDATAADALPKPDMLDGVVITGSSAGVYDELVWLEPLRQFIRNAYAAEVPMLGICFGHQIMADALGGDVRKSEKGWGLGRHHYNVRQHPSFFLDAPDRISVACSHQDQVIEAPADAEVILASEFTPNAGLLYRSGRALSFQPHPEFLDDYAVALCELRRGQIADDGLAAALESFDKPSDSDLLARCIARFFVDRTR